MLGGGSQLSWSHSPRLPFWCCRGNNLLGKLHQSEKVEHGLKLETEYNVLQRCAREWVNGIQGSYYGACPWRQTLNWSFMMNQHQRAIYLYSNKAHRVQCLGSSSVNVSAKAHWGSGDFTLCVYIIHETVHRVEPVWGVRRMQLLYLSTLLWTQNVTWPQVYVL